MSSPTEKHREIAKVIYDALGRGSTRDEEVIARALAKSEREGMKRERERCAEIASDFEDEDILIGKDVAEIIRNTILSEAGEGE